MKKFFLLFFVGGSLTLSGQTASTANENVIIPEDSVYISSLDRYRKLRIYLPGDYSTREEKYPVLYMMDGQNLFDNKTSYAGEWGIDEILDSLERTGQLKLIVVGIDNGKMHRMQEYSPWDHSRFGEGEGAEFVEFIVNELKPAIDAEYRTLSGPENTGIMGSSMGGLISHYALFNHPDVFRKAGIFSPSYWYSNDVWGFTESKKPSEGMKIHMLVGSKEGSGMEQGVKRMQKSLKSIGFPAVDFTIIIDPEGQHNEKFWRKYAAEAFLFLFAN